MLTFWYGLALAPNQVIDVATGTFNTFPFRILALVSIGLLQVGATHLTYSIVFNKTLNDYSEHLHFIPSQFQIILMDIESYGLIVSQRNVLDKCPKSKHDPW